VGAQGDYMITRIYNDAIWYTYKDDEITWNGTHYLSLSCCGEFKTLQDLDYFWDSYNNVQGQFYTQQFELYG
jgi:hypothetical protein